MATHLIRKQIIELEVPAVEQALDFQQRVSRLVQEQLSPALNDYFDRISPSNQILRIDQLTLTIQITKAAALEEQLVDQVLQSLQEYLVSPLEYIKPEAGPRPSSLERTERAQKTQLEESFPAEPKVVSEQKASWEAFAFFLKKGYLPWWAFFGSFEEFSTKTLAFLQEHKSDFLGDFLQTLLQNNFAVERLVYQFPPEVVDNVLRLTAGLPVSEAILRKLAENETAKRNSLESTIQTESEIEEKQVKGKEPPTENTSTTSGERGQEDESEGLYIQNAGLVLLAPFLETYLQSGGVAIDKTLVRPSEAAHWIQFLATGQTYTPEPELLLNKILCGLPLETPVPAEVPPFQMYQEEALKVLEAVIRYWTVLKNTSPAGLRESFLQRSGRLSRKPDGDWLLQIEQKSYDMLLESLPWSYSLIKLPWMPQTLWVDWA